MPPMATSQPTPPWWWPRPPAWRRKPLADVLRKRLAKQPDVLSAEVAGPGFINLRLKATFWPKILNAVLELGDNYGRSELGKGIKTNVEYVSANPTGPLHVGHCRGAVFGDALAALLTVTGYDVTTEYYINDAGAQVDTVARSAFLRYREALGEGHWRNSGGPLSRRISEAGGPGAWPPSMEKIFWR